MRKENNIIDLIPKGRPNAISTAKLCSALGKDVRTVRERVSKARARGYIIITDRKAGGYYQPDPADPECRKQLIEYYHSAKRQARTILYGLKAVKTLLRKTKGQQRLFDDDTEL